MYLQLGATGVAALLAVLLAAAAAVYRAVRNGVEEAPALAGMLLAGALLLVVQSYVYAVGNVATMTFWVAATTCAGVTGARR